MTRSNSLRLSVDEIREITGYAHWIPIVRGYHHEFIQSRYPGWVWNQFLPVLDREGLIGKHIEGHACIRLRLGICMRPGIQFIELAVQRGRTRVTRIECEKDF